VRAPHLGCDSQDAKGSFVAKREKTKGSSPKKDMVHVQRPASELPIFQLDRIAEKTEELLGQTELLNLSHDAILIRDLHDRIIFWNGGAERLFGWPREQAVGQVSHDLLQTQFPGSLDETTRGLLESGLWEGELRHRAKNGSEIVTSSRWALRRDGEGHSAGVMEAHTDVTAQRILEGQLRQAQKMEAIGVLAGGIAHDFNNVLGAIIGNTEMALDEASIDSPVALRLGQVLKATIRARDLTREILTFSRRSEKERKPMRLAPLVKETHKLLRASLPAFIDVRLDIRVDDDIVTGNASDLQQVIMNLATNAAQAMPEGGLLEIEVIDALLASGEAMPDPDLRPGPYLVLRVRDSGTGMEESVRRRVFEPFFTTKGESEGTGLGLTVAYGIVKSHDGAIVVESEPCKGSLFRVFLPKAEESVHALAVRSRKAPRGKETILFVDDEESLTQVAEGILSRLGYTVFTRMSASAALELFCAQPDTFDIVITDQTMPGMTGITLAKSLLRVRPDLPIVLCTGYSDAVSQASAKTAGVREFLMKPIARQDLAEAVRRALRKE
jgi:PAS domain S-box-containing protein